MELQLDLALSINPGNRPGPNLDCGNQIKRGFDEAFNRNSEEEDDPIVVGWPPVKSWRKQLCHHIRRGCAANYVNVENSGGGGGDRRGPNHKYVKVKMEGVGITRKVDLSNYHCYQTLVAYLVALFGKCQENVDDYKLIYQNKEGDWLHARDVPWESLMKSIQRLKMEKNRE